jgi:hypothetical protein
MYIKINLKKSKKICEKVLTKVKKDDIMMKLSERDGKKQVKNQKKDWKVRKNLKKVLDKE